MTFDAQAATAAYINSLGPQALARAAAYTTGNHWLLFWNLTVTVLVTWGVVRVGLLERVAARVSPRRVNLRVFTVCAVYSVASSLLGAPWTIYTNWWRETAYGRTSQPFADFLGQSALALVLSTLIGALFLVALYALIRRTGRYWWAWSGGLTATAVAGLMLAAPIFIEPLFNDYKPVPEGPVRAALVPMAAQAGVPTDRIYVYNGSRQSNNFTANVSGIGRSARVAISDIAFKGASIDEVRAVTGHEIGHYVLGHVWRGVLVISLLSVAAFYLADRLFPRFARALGSSAALDDPVGVPILLLIVSVLGLAGEPLLNALSRYDETEADRYSLSFVNLPDALASSLVKTAEYRNPRPGALEEALFYDHPSVEHRVRMAMEWKTAHPPSATAGH
ncbi:MAG TPA: M48 family metallopeptidase [Steroidobacteraceae bacterium]|nr:M48 family metallopeptidase [Steroidobacteraceae bacterium]